MCKDEVGKRSFRSNARELGLVLWIHLHSQAPCDKHTRHMAETKFMLMMIIFTVFGYTEKQL